MTETNLPVAERSRKPTPSRAKRRDALARREMILAAAALVFAERGFESPLQDICERAGVGRATLYRNFENRTELALALIERDITALERFATEKQADPQAVYGLIALLMERQVLSAGLIFLLANHPKKTADLTTRFENLMRPLIDTAKQAGTVRPSLELADFVLLTNMILGALQGYPYAMRRSIIPSMLDLCRRAIAP